MLSGTAPDDIKLTELVFKGRKYIPPDLLKEIANIGGICNYSRVKRVFLAVRHNKTLNGSYGGGSHNIDLIFMVFLKFHV